MSVADARRELDALERLRGQLGAVSRQEEGDRRRALVGLRRQLVIQVANVTRACDPLFASSAPAAHLSGEWRERLSGARAALALHQANWPAVKIDDDRAAYLASANAARAAEKDLMNWLHDVLDALEHHRPLPAASA